MSETRKPAGYTLGNLNIAALMILTVLLAGLGSCSHLSPTPRNNNRDTGNATPTSTRKHNSKKDMKTERLTYFYFDHHNSMAESGERYTVSIEKDGKIKVILGGNFQPEKVVYLDDDAIFDGLTDIVKTYKMDKYKAEYNPMFEIYDGDSWSLYYRYDSGRSVSSGGYMEWPDNYHDARQALSDYFRKWRD